jgi:hypothetical protein
MISSRQRYNARLAAIALVKHEATCAPSRALGLPRIVRSESGKTRPGTAIAAAPGSTKRALERPVCRPRGGALTFVTDRAAPLSCERSSSTTAVAHNMTARTLEPALLEDRSKIGFRNLEGARFAERRAHRWWSALPEPNALQPSARTTGLQTARRRAHICDRPRGTAVVRAKQLDHRGRSQYDRAYARAGALRRPIKIGFRNLEGARFAERRAHRWWSARPEPNALQPSARTTGLQTARRRAHICDRPRGTAGRASEAARPPRSLTI